MKHDRYIPEADAAEALGISRRAVRTWRSTPDSALLWVKINGRVHIVRESIDLELRRRERSAPQRRV